MATEQTLRQAIEAGERGEFAKALMGLYDEPSWDAYAYASMKAYPRFGARAHRKDQLLLEGAFLRDTQSETMFSGNFRHFLRGAFPYLAHLTEPASEWPTCEVASDGN